MKNTELLPPYLASLSVISLLGQHIYYRFRGTQSRSLQNASGVTDALQVSNKTVTRRLHSLRSFLCLSLLAITAYAAWIARSKPYSEHENARMTHLAFYVSTEGFTQRVRMSLMHARLI